MGDVPTFYANNTQLAITNWDVSLIFGVIEEIDDENQLIRRVARVNMSLHHAKAVSRILAEHIAGYEREIGPLVIPSEADSSTEQQPPASQSPGAAQE